MGTVSTIQRARIWWGAALAAAMLAAPVSAGTAAKFVVTSLGDADDETPGDGIVLDNGADGVTIQGCYIGINARGDAAAPNEIGILIRSDDNSIGQSFWDVEPHYRGRGNVISGNRGDGIRIDGGLRNDLLTNRIGTDYLGTSGVGNGGYGVHVALGGGNDIGASSYPEVAGNTISDNGAGGVLIGAGATSNRISNNSIGTDGEGSAPLGNHAEGIVILDRGNEVRGNVISANRSDGVRIGDTENAVSGGWVSSNAIGVDAERRSLLGNGDDGIEVTNGTSTTIDGNVIGGNQDGVKLRGDDCVVLRNWIGTNGANDDLGNLSNGIEIHGDFHTIGRESYGNFIGFNESGIALQSDASENLVRGNWIGTLANGARVGNRSHGVEIIARGRGNRVGGGHGDVLASHMANVIAHNGGAGIRLTDPEAAANGLRGNRVFGNDGLGIDLGEEGTTLNDFGDGDTGPNRLQNFPVFDSILTRIDEVSGRLEVRYRVESNIGDSVYPLEVDFYLAGRDGEGRTYVGSDEYPEGSAGAFRIAAFGVPEGLETTPFLVATATDAEVSAGNTSEFSEPLLVPEPAVAMGQGEALSALAFCAVRRSRSPWS